MNDLRGTQMPEDEAGSNKYKIYGGAIVAAAIGVVAVYGFATGMWNTPPPKVATFNVAANEVAPPVPPPVEMGSTTPVVPAAAPVREVTAPVQRIQKAPTIKAARVHVRTPVATVPDEIAPVAAPVLAPIDITPPPAPLQTPVVLTAPVPPAPAPTVQPQQ